MKIALAIIFPPLGVLACGKFGQFLLNIFFCIIGVWIGGIIHAVYVVMKHDQDQRHNEMIHALRGSSPMQPGTSHAGGVETPKKGTSGCLLLGVGVLCLIVLVNIFASTVANLKNAETTGVAKSQEGEQEAKPEKAARANVEKPAAPSEIEEEKKEANAPTIFDARTWTSADGQRTFVGRLTQMGDGQLTVEKDGEQITFPIARLSEADRRFLGQGVTITTVDGTTHENGSVVRISADSILFRKGSGPVSIPMESLPENLQHHFAYDPEIAAELRKARERQLAIMQEQQAAAAAKAEREQAAADSRQETRNKLDSFMAILDMVGAGNGIVTNASAKGDTITVTVAPGWHYQPKRVRQKIAQMLWQAWAMTASPENVDMARISLRDAVGNEVGGSRLLAGSLIWVED